MNMLAYAKEMETRAPTCPSVWTLVVIVAHDMFPPPALIRLKLEKTRCDFLWKGERDYIMHERFAPAAFFSLSALTGKEVLSLFDESCATHSSMPPLHLDTTSSSFQHW